jgi:hypothetical protein
VKRGDENKKTERDREKGTETVATLSDNHDEQGGSRGDA